MFLGWWWGEQHILIFFYKFIFLPFYAVSESMCLQWQQQIWAVSSTTGSVKKINRKNLWAFTLPNLIENMSYFYSFCSLVWASRASESGYTFYWIVSSTMSSYILKKKKPRSSTLRLTEKSTLCPECWDWICGLEAI